MAACTAMAAIRLLRLYLVVKTYGNKTSVATRRIAKQNQTKQNLSV
jgi:hypothetical protein